MHPTPLQTAAPNAVSPNPMTGLVNYLLGIPPLWNFAKSRARTMMINRAESIGVPWRERVQALQRRGGDAVLDPGWEADLEAIADPQIAYPAYYTTSFHAYDEGNLGWRPALEVEVAAQAVHARIWPEAGAQGDAKLRQSYHDVLKAQLPAPPEAIADLGCGVGMSTLSLQHTFPEARVTGVDLSPYFLAVAQYREHQSASPSHPITWHHAPAEATRLPAATFDLVSACLMFHELPQAAAIAIIQEARRLLRPGGHLAIMDMNPSSEVFTKMPPFVLTLLKSTEPYLDEYMTLDFQTTMEEAGFTPPTVTANSPRHRTLLARVR